VESHGSVEAGVAPSKSGRGASNSRDTALFREIFEQESSYVYNTLRRLGVREADLPDLTHDVFVVLYRGLDDYDASLPARPWLFAAAFRVASDHRRRARVQREVLAVDDLKAVDEAPPVDQQIAAHQDRALVIAALDDLDLDKRAVFVMHDLDGHTIPEISRVLSIPLNTAYSRLRLAREQFRESVQRLRRRRGEP